MLPSPPDAHLRTGEAVPTFRTRSAPSPGDQRQALARAQGLAVDAEQALARAETEAARVLGEARARADAARAATIRAAQDEAGQILTAARHEAARLLTEATALATSIAARSAAVLGGLQACEKALDGDMPRPDDEVVTPRAEPDPPD